MVKPDAENTNNKILELVKAHEAAQARKIKRLRKYINDQNRRVLEIIKEKIDQKSQ